MSANASLNTPGYLPTLFSGGSAGNSLLASLSQLSGGSQVMADPVLALRQAVTGGRRQIALISAEAQIRCDLAGFTSALSAATTPARLLESAMAMKVVLTAHGLIDQVNNVALARQALLCDPTAADSLVNQLSDMRWPAVNRACGFAKRGLAVLNSAQTVGVLGRLYAEAVWRARLDAATPGLAFAVDFVNRAGSIATSEQVLADPAARAVLLHQPGAPPQTAYQPPTSLDIAGAERVDFTALRDEARVEAIAHRYLAAVAEARADTADDDAFLLDTPVPRPVGLIR
jgi:hypothetical protein